MGRIRISYLKSRIIVTFSVFAIVLVLVMSQFSYRFVKNLYLRQLSEQVTYRLNVVAAQIEPQMTDLLLLGNPEPETRDYFNKLFSIFLESDFMVFRKNFTVAVSGDSNIAVSGFFPQLMLYKTEIAGLKEHRVITTRPFYGDDQQWYLWGFYRLDENLVLAYRASAAELKQVQQFASYFWIIGIAGVLLTIFLGWILANLVAKPIYRLVDFSRNIGSGDYRTPVPQNFKGEIAVLAGALENMRKNILRNHREREKILANIAHEIKNPLGGIELMANLNREQILAGKADLQYSGRITDEITTLKVLIDSFLNYSKPVIINAEQFDIGKQFEQVAELFRESLTSKNIQLKQNIECAAIYFDKKHMRQILINLMTNSLENIQNGGTILFSCKTLNSKMIIEFSDSGTGTKVEPIEKVFEPFLSGRDGGTGLGLAICKKLAEENGWQITARNNPPNGFSVLIISEQHHA